MKKRKAQVTLLIIIAIIVVLAVITIFTIRNSQSKEFFSSPENQEKINSIKSQINTCIDSSIDQSLILIGDQGGYFDKPNYAYTEENLVEEEIFLEEGQNFIPYYYHEGLILHPSTRVVESELSKAISSFLPDCINNIESTFSITQNNPRVSSTIQSKKIDFSINHPISVSSNQYSTSVFRNFKYTKESSLGDILFLASEMTSAREQNPTEDCISCLAEISEEKNLYLEVYNFDQTTTLVGIYENYTFDQQTFLFLNKFKENEV